MDYQRHPKFTWKSLHFELPRKYTCRHFSNFMQFGKINSRRINASIFCLLMPCFLTHANRRKLGETKWICEIRFSPNPLHPIRRESVTDKLPLLLITLTYSNTTTTNAHSINSPKTRITKSSCKNFQERFMYFSFLPTGHGKRSGGLSLSGENRPPFLPAFPQPKPLWLSYLLQKMKRGGKNPPQQDFSSKGD